MSLIAEIDDYFYSFYLLDISTAILGMVVLFDVLSLILYNVLDELRIKSWIEMVVLTLNFGLVIAFTIVGYWDSSWQFKTWSKYTESEKSCFKADKFENMVKGLMETELKGVQYMGIVRIISIFLLIALAATYGYTLWKNWDNIKQWVKSKRNPPKKAKSIRSNRYRESPPGSNRAGELEMSQLGEYADSDTKQNPDNSDLMALKPNSRIPSTRPKSVFQGVGEKGEVTFPGDDV